MKNGLNKKELSKALLKKALGYSLEEVIEEYVVDKEQETLVLNKKKITKKNIPPDMTAVKTLLELYKQKAKNDFSNLTDEQLNEEKIKLLKQLKEYEKGEQNATRKSKS